MSEKKTSFITYFIIVVAALGYFVDIYDLILFNVVKKESLEVIMQGAAPELLKSTGIFLFNMQMTGMLIGGILWGVWGDKKGRLSVLFGSILLYSAANILNAFVTSIPMYAIIRVVAGIGLAGELGAGITLVSETMSKEKRGYGTMIIVSFGALGAVAAALVGANGQAIGNVLGSIFNTTFANWQVAYILGGVMGLLLLMLRVGTIESGMFKSVLHSEVSKGDIRMLFNNKERFLKYLNCILIGLPIWYFIGLIVANSELIWAKDLQIQGKVVNGSALMYAYIGLSVGDVFSGLISQLLRSRRKVVLLYLAFSIVLLTYYLFFATGISVQGFYLLTFLVGCATGYWAIFVTIAAEQFGTNIRATVTTTTPNFVRGAVPLITMLFQFLSGSFLNNVTSAFVVGVVCLGLSLWAILRAKETFAKDLDYTEQYP
ncbi:MAG TPA: MFS transporter [Chitinophagales bacterium]|nr:MFS transporter [Chitinophagales bacterium]